MYICIYLTSMYLMSGVLHNSIKIPYCMPVSIIGLNLKSTGITVLSNNGNHAVM